MHIWCLATSCALSCTRLTWYMPMITSDGSERSRAAWRSDHHQRAAPAADRLDAGLAVLDLHAGVRLAVLV